MSIYIYIYIYLSLTCNIVHHAHYDIYRVSTDIIQKTRGIFSALKRELTIIYRRSAYDAHARSYTSCECMPVSVCASGWTLGCVKCVDYAATWSAQI